MTARTGLRIVVLVALVLLVQWTLGLDITIAGAHPNLMVLLPIAAGVAAGPAEGTIVGFVSGIAADLLLPTPFGLSAFVGCLVGFVVGVTTGDLTREVWWFPGVVAFVASVGAVLVYALLGAVLGQEQFLRADLAAIVLVVAVCNAVLAAPAFRLLRWVLRPSQDRPPTPASGGRW